MTQLLSGKILGGELEPDLLGLGFVMSSVGDGGSVRGWGVVGRSLIAMPRIRGSTIGDPLSSFVTGALLSLATMNAVMPSDGLTNRPKSTDVLGVGNTEQW
jgi:hypothetical protein